MEIEPFLSAVLVVVSAAAAYYLSFLTLSGAVAGLATGGMVALGFGFPGLVLMGAFFISSSVLSKLKVNKKRRHFEKNLHEKGSTRDWKQVAANGGIAAAAAGVGAFVTGDDIWAIIYMISLASATADTWASELGPLSKGDPVSIRGFAKVPPGTSGAVSFAGTLASFAGSMMIALLSSFLFHPGMAPVILVTLAGFSGSLIDTWLGAYIQALYRCGACGIHTEKRKHCKSSTRLVRGFSWLDNDAVNFFSGFGAVLFGIILLMVF
ncbi:DUF92 domain-containing protein [Mesobacillus zeae]|uniref:DUF92 domain-containing protein n=1 Tax=Mesobacillus zeae TaxID=1917180 RepID=UPI0015E6D670|nr:DUF92 domain-containing protein [Mesobacillus zeae]